MLVLQAASHVVPFSGPISSPLSSLQHDDVCIRNARPGAGRRHDDDDANFGVSNVMAVGWTMSLVHDSDACCLKRVRKCRNERVRYSGYSCGSRDRFA